MHEGGPHNYEGSDRDARLMEKADVLFIVGLGMEDELARKLLAGTPNKQVKLVALGEAVPKAERMKGQCHHQHKPGEQHDHGEDPHVWLGIPHAVYLVEKLRDELKAVDPEHAAGYDRRAAEYVARLNKLRDDGRAMLAGKSERKILSFHESLNYFAHTYGLEVAGVIETTPGAEPNADDLAEIVELCQDHKVRLIAVEPQFSQNSSAATIKRELYDKGIKDAAFVEIDPLETARAEELSVDLYERRMRANLENLAK